MIELNKNELSQINGGEGDVVTENLETTTPDPVTEPIENPVATTPQTRWWQTQLFAGVASSAGTTVFLAVAGMVLVKTGLIGVNK
jgi:bacteriocin-like protein